MVRGTHPTLARTVGTNIAEARKYLDIKKGLKRNEIFQVLQDSSDSPFSSKDWMNWLNTLDLKISKTCLKEKECQNSKNCDCIITTGLGDKILDAVIKHINIPTKEQPTEQEIAKMVD
jgi:hypothetical protein